MNGEYAIKVDQGCKQEPINVNGNEAKMSYAAKIKQELADSFPQSRNARISEAAVIFAACGKIDELRKA